MTMKRGTHGLFVVGIAAACLSLAGCGSGLRIEDVKEGSGPGAKKWQEITVHYTGRLEDGTKFDSSHDRKEPFTFQLGSNKVIQGWNEGLIGMKVGGVRKLTIPPSLGYGDKASGRIPPNSTLIFEVELLKIEG